MRKIRLRWKIRGKHLSSGKTGCGKTSFVQKIGINKLFGDLGKVE